MTPQSCRARIEKFEARLRKMEPTQAARALATRMGKIAVAADFLYSTKGFTRDGAAAAAFAFQETEERPT